MTTVSANYQGSGDSVVAAAKPSLPGLGGAGDSHESNPVTVPTALATPNFGHSTSRLDAANALADNWYNENQSLPDNGNNPAQTQAEIEGKNKKGNGNNAEKRSLEDDSFELQVSNCRETTEHREKVAEHRGKETLASFSEVFSYQNRGRAPDHLDSLDKILNGENVVERLKLALHSESVSLDTSLAHKSLTDLVNHHSFRRGDEGSNDFNGNGGSNGNGNTAETEDAFEMVEQERLRRKHCEHQIKELHSRCLDLEQQLAVARDAIRKKDNNIHTLDQTMNQLLVKWRNQENERQEKIKEALSEKERLASAVSSQQSVIETFEKDFTEAIGQIEFLQQKNKRLEEELQSSAESKRAERDKWEKEAGQWEAKQSGWKAEREDLLKQKNRLISERDRLKKENEENSKKLDQINSKHLKETSTEKKLLEAESKKCKDLKREISALQKTLESLNQQLESERSEKSSLAAEMEIHTSRHQSELSKVRQNCEKESKAKLEREVSSLNEQWEHRLGEERRQHKTELRKVEENFKSAMENMRNELMLENAQKVKEMRKVTSELELRNQSIQNEMSIVQSKADNTYNQTLELKRCFERNYLEVLNLLEKSLNADPNLQNAKRSSFLSTAEQDSHGVMVPQKLNHTSANLTSSTVPNSHSDHNNSFRSSYAEPPANVPEYPYFTRFLNENRTSISIHELNGKRLEHPRDSTSEGVGGRTERLELPPPLHGLNSSARGSLLTGLTSSTPAGIQFYSAGEGTTPSDETGTAPFESRESMEGEEMGNHSEAIPRNSHSQYSSADSKDQPAWSSLHSTNFSASCMNSSYNAQSLKHSNSGRSFDGVINGNATSSFEDSSKSTKKFSHSSSHQLSTTMQTSNRDSSKSSSKSHQSFSHSRDHDTSTGSASLNDSRHSISKSSASAVTENSSSATKTGLPFSASNISSNHSRSLKSGTRSGLAPDARYTVSFHSASESPSPLIPAAKTDTISVRERRLSHGSSHSGNDAHEIGSLPLKNNGYPPTGLDSEVEDDDDGYDVDNQDLSDVSSETLAINSSSPAPHQVPQEPQGDGDMPQASFGFAMEQFSHSHSANLHREAHFTPPEKQPASKESVSGRPFLESDGHRTFRSEYDLNVNLGLNQAASEVHDAKFKGDSNQTVTSAEQRDKELQSYIQMLLSKPSNLGLDAFSGASLPQSSQERNEVSNGHLQSKQGSQNETPSKNSVISTNATGDKKGGSVHANVKTSTRGTTTVKPWK